MEQGPEVAVNAYDWVCTHYAGDMKKL